MAGYATDPLGCAEFAEAQALTQLLLGGGGGGVGYGTLMETNGVGRFDVEEGVFVMSASEGDAL
jgi:hypothetical protein